MTVTDLRRLNALTAENRHLKLDNEALRKRLSTPDLHCMSRAYGCSLKAGSPEAVTLDGTVNA